jgi:hypothetical protein
MKIGHIKVILKMGFIMDRAKWSGKMVIHTKEVGKKAKWMEPDYSSIEMASL